VITLEPNRTLVLEASYDLFGKSFDPRTGRVPGGSVHGTWGFHLREEPAGQTRLVVRTRSRRHRHLLNRPLTMLLGEPVHFIMQTRQFHNLRARVATAEVDREPAR
jgi:hypothetical protein